MIELEECRDAQRWPVHRDRFHRECALFTISCKDLAPHGPGDIAVLCAAWVACS